MEIRNIGTLTHNFLQIKKITKKITQNLELIDDNKIPSLFAMNKKNFYERNIMFDLQRDITQIKKMWDEIEGIDAN